MTRLSDFLAGRGPTQMYDTYWIPGSLDLFARALAAHVSPNDNVLDVGSGTGLVAQHAMQRATSDGHVACLEPTPFMLDSLHVKFSHTPNIDVTEGTVESIPFDDDAFDVILCHQAFQYFEDLPQAFREMYRVLRPGGTMAGGVWSGPQDQHLGLLESSFREYLGDEFAPIHAWSFGGLERLKKLAEGAGFKIERLAMETQPMRFRSVEEMVFVHLAGGMRVENGEVLMGLFDLEEPSYEPKVEAMVADLEKRLAQFVSPDGFDIPFGSDVVVATK